MEPQALTSYLLTGWAQQEAEARKPNGLLQAGSPGTEQGEEVRADLGEAKGTNSKYNDLSVL